ncbi:MAG: dTMP kinase [Patescibacteria group bacterium]
MFKNKLKGKFIALEGLDGAGGSTQASLLHHWFKKQKKDVWLTQEPTNNVIGSLIRGYLTGDWKTPSAKCLQLLFASDRANHLEKEIIPRLEKGIHVITDRYFLSSLAYGSLEIEDIDWLYQINSQFLLPDLTILLNVSPKTCLKRIQENRVGLELFEDEERLRAVWKTYETLSKKYPDIKVIDGEKNEDEIFEKIRDEVKKIV